MISNSEFISRVVGGLKAITKDAHVSYRYILSIGRAKAKKIIGQKLSDMRLNKDDSLITKIECVKMEKVSYKDCGIVEFKLCKNLMRSCCKVPELMYSTYGPAIYSISSVDGSKVYTYMTPNQYAREQKLKYRRPGNYYYIEDGYLYLPDSKVELLDISILTMDKSETYKLSNCTEEKGCTSKLDYDFICPDRHLDTVTMDTINEVANFYRTTPEDENPNMDTHQKTKTTI